MGDENDSVRVYLRNFFHHSFSAYLPGLRECLLSCKHAGNRGSDEFPDTLAVSYAHSNAFAHPVAITHAHGRPAGRIYAPFFV